MGWPDEEVEGITIAGYLHDIGKLIVDLSVINSPERFSAKDSVEMSRHPAAGYEILAPISHPYADIPLMARNHHERMDGNGYPDGLKGDQIPPGARIVTLADSFDAMTTDRPYRKKLPLEDVLEDFRANTGTQFDPEVVCAFCRAFLNEIEGKKGKAAAQPAEPELQQHRTVKPAFECDAFGVQWRFQSRCHQRALNLDQRFTRPRSVRSEMSIESPAKVVSSV
jgi:HD-GYP domain-containing protein (c-di-GMP phosphodiesterase class II)